MTCSSKLIICVLYRNDLPKELWGSITHGFTLRDLYTLSKVSSQLRAKIKPLPVWKRTSSTISKKPQNEPFEFIIKKLWLICEECNKLSENGGSKIPIKIYTKENDCFRHLCLQCRKKHTTKSTPSAIALVYWWKV